MMKIATFNVNGVNGRLPVLLRWLGEAQPDIVCLQELKAPQEKFPEARDPRGGLWRDLARAEKLERRRHPGARRRSGRDAARPARRSRRHAQPLYRGGGRRSPDRLPLSAERQSGARPEVRLQAALVRAARRPRQSAAGQRARRSSSPATTTSCRPSSTSTSRSAGSTTRCSGPKSAPPIAACVAQGWTDALRDTASGRAHLHLLGLFPERLRPRRRAAHRPSAAEPAVARRLKAAAVDRDVRGWEKASDHAPTWIELTDAKPVAHGRRPTR